MGLPPLRWTSLPRTTAAVHGSGRAIASTGPRVEANAVTTPTVIRTGAQVTRSRPDGSRRGPALGCPDHQPSPATAAHTDGCQTAAEQEIG